MAQNKVIFARLTQSKYDALGTTVDSNTVYFCLDSGRIYQGSTLVGEAGGSIKWQYYQSQSNAPAKSAVLGRSVLGEMVLGQQ